MPQEGSFPAAESSFPAVEGSSPAAESSSPTAKSSSPRRREPESSFPRRREPIPGPSPVDTDDPRTSDAAESSFPAAESSSPTAESSSPTAESSFPRSREPIPIPSPVDADDLEADDPEESDSQPGCYDIDRKIAEAQRDPSHPIHKFVQAYDEVAAVFHGEDNDDDEEVRYWISGEVPDAYGKYIWEYAPAYPRSIRRRLRPRRRRRSTPKAESVWMKRPTDKLREAGVPPPKRTLIWV